MCRFRDYFKRKKAFKYLQGKKIIFLQETHSTQDVELFWKCQMRESFYFSHGTNKLQGLLIFVRLGFNFEELEFKMNKKKVDTLYLR